MTAKKKKILAAVTAVILAAGMFGAGAAFGAGGAQPGSQGDPIVTLSYLESRLAGTGSAASSSSGGFRRIELIKGEKLILGDGCMLTVTSGSGKVAGKNGLINLASGELFGDGTSAVLYSLFLSAGDDGGITADSAMTIYVSGSAQIK